MLARIVITERADWTSGVRGRNPRMTSASHTTGGPNAWFNLAVGVALMILAAALGRWLPDLVVWLVSGLGLVLVFTGGVRLLGGRR